MDAFSGAAEGTAVLSQTAIANQSRRLASGAVRKKRKRHRRKARMAYA